MAKLFLDFTGLCTFVEHPDGMKVLLVEGRKQQQNLMHLATIVRFNRRHLAGTSPQNPDLLLEKRLPPHTLDSLCFLPNGDYSIRADITTQNLEVERTKRTDRKEDPTNADREDWSWVAELERIKDGAGKPKTVWFDAKPPAEIGARFTLKRGRFTTLDFLRKLSTVGQPGKVDIFGLTSTYKQAFASFARCAMDVGSGNVTLVHQPFGGSANDFLVFDPQGSDLTIEIWNTPFADVMDTFFPGDGDHKWTHGLGPGVSFKHFYRLNDVPGQPHPNNPTPGSNMVDCSKTQKDQGCSPTQALPFGG